MIVFFVVGVWHGAAWKYIVYGMYNGIIIAFSGLMAENYRKWKKKLHISGKETWYYLFTVIRTFVLVVISMYFDRADSVRQAFHMMKQSITQFAPAQLLLIPAGKQGTSFTPYVLSCCDDVGHSNTACSCRHIFFELAGGCGICVYLRG